LIDAQRERRARAISAIALSFESRDVAASHQPSEPPPGRGDVVVLAEYRTALRKRQAKAPADDRFQRSQDEPGLDALTLRSDCAREAYGNLTPLSENEGALNPLIIRDNRARQALGYEVTR
jgi:hypothetical protein